MAKTGWVDIYHPDLPKTDGEHQTARVTQRAFELQWDAKGWKVKDDNAPAPVPAARAAVKPEGEK
jgi:hypothetical protein